LSEHPERHDQEPEDRDADQPSPEGLAFPLDPSVLRAIEAYRQSMLRLQRQVEPALEMARRAAEAAAPALRAYDSFMKTHGAELAKAIGPFVESASRAASVLEKIDWAALLAVMRAALPPNWDENVDLDIIESVLNDEGIPLVFVPNNAVLHRLLAASDRTARVAVLLQAKDEILQDCQTTLAQVTHSSLAGQLPLAKDAVAACQDGHFHSGQALAVSVVETVVSHILGMNYNQAKFGLVLDLDDLPYTEVRVKAALAPIPKFYTSWYPTSGAPIPIELSRHVSIHQADVQHYTEENAVIAAMLTASVLRAVDESQQKAHPESAV
jgi:hypothetical protein